MAQDKKNKKIPESDAEWEYPWNQVTQTLGGHEIFYNSTPEKESWRHKDPSGSYVEHTKDGHKVEVVAAQRNSLTSQGETHTVEGAHDKLVLGGVRDTNIGGYHGEIAQNMSRGIYGQVVEAAKGLKFHYTDDQYQRTSAGGKVEDHNDGFAYNNAKESKVCMTTENRIIGTEKEYANYTGGNWDTYGDKKGRLFFKEDLKIKSDANINIEAKEEVEIKAKTITLKADQKIVLKVGGSTITITDGSIKVESSGEVMTKGSVTNIQGGGLIAPPTTFK